MTETQTQTIFTAPGCVVIPKTIGEAEEILRAHIESQEYWTVIADGYGWPLAEAIIRKFYWDAPPEDLFACVTRFKGVMLGVIVLRRRLMSAKQYRRELARQNVMMSQRELVSGGALIRVASFNRARAREFGKTLDLATEGDELAVAA